MSWDGGSEKNEEASQENLLNPFTHLRYGYAILTDCLLVLWWYTQNYFWHGLFGILIFCYVYKRLFKDRIAWMRQKYYKYQGWRREKEYEAKYHKNPDLFSERISAQQSYAQKLQERYRLEAERYEEKMKQKEEERRQEILAETTVDPGHRLGNGTDSDKKSKSLRPEYNPLMGPRGSSYRPAKKNMCPGGGCGR